MERFLATLPDNVRVSATKFLRAIRSSPPAALGTPFERQ
jgi:hypothetical protein